MTWEVLAHVYLVLAVATLILWIAEAFVHWRR